MNILLRSGRDGEDYISDVVRVLNVCVYREAAARLHNQRVFLHTHASS